MNGKSKIKYDQTLGENRVLGGGGCNHIGMQLLYIKSIFYMYVVLFVFKL